MNHSTQVTDFRKPSAGQPFSTVTVKLGGELGLSTRHITTSMSVLGSEVTIFFDSIAEIKQFASELLEQAEKSDDNA